MNLSSKVLSDAWFSALRSGISIFRKLTVIPLITKLLGSGSYGVWVVVLAFIGVVQEIGGMHLHGSLIRYGILDEEKEQTYIDTVVLSIILGMIISIIVLLIGVNADLSNIIEKEYSSYLDLILVSALLVFSNIVLKVNLNFPRAKQKVKMFEISRMVKQIIEIFALTLIFFLGGNVIQGIFGLLAISIASNIVFFIIIFTKYEIPCPDIENYIKYFKYSLPMIPKSISEKILSNIDKYLIIYYLSPTAVGIYGVAYSVSRIFRVFTQLLNSTLYPRIADNWEKQNIDEVEYLYNSIFRYLTIVAIPAIFGITLISEPLLSLISTKEIADNGWVLIPVISIGFLFRGYENPLPYILTAVEETGKIAKSVILASLVNVLLNIWWIPIYGLIGAAIATSISQFIIFVMISYYSSNYLQYPVPLDELKISIVSSIGMMFFLSILPINGHPLVVIVSYTFSGIFIYFTIVYIFNGISKNEIKKIKNLIN